MSFFKKWILKIVGLYIEERLNYIRSNVVQIETKDLVAYLKDFVQCTGCKVLVHQASAYTDMAKVGGYEFRIAYCLRCIHQPLFEVDHQRVQDLQEKFYPKSYKKEI